MPIIINRYFGYINVYEIIIISNTKFVIIVTPVTK